jgi:hypothetical protein
VYGHGYFICVIYYYFTFEAEKFYIKNIQNIMLLYVYLTTGRGSKFTKQGKEKCHSKDTILLDGIS